MAPTIRNRTRHRRGLATLELVMALPLMLVLVSAIFSGAAIAMNRLQVSVRVRREAWTQRQGRPSPRTLGLPVVSPIGRLAGVSTDGGLILQDRSQTVRLSSVLSRLTHTAQFQHAVMGGSWDNTSIPFRPKSPAQPDPRFSAFPGGTVGPFPPILVPGSW